MKVCAVNDEEVIPFDTLTMCRRWIEVEGFADEDPPLYWAIYKSSDMGRRDAEPIEIHHSREYVEYLVTYYGYTYLESAWVDTLEEALVTADQFVRSRRIAVEIYKITPFGRTLIKKVSPLDYRF